MSADWRRLGVGDGRCGLERLGEDVSDRSGGLIDIEQRGEGGGEIDGSDAATIYARCEGRSVETERNMAVVGPGAEVGGAAARVALHLVVTEDGHDIPAAVGGVAVGEELAEFAAGI